MLRNFWNVFSGIVAHRAFSSATRPNRKLDRLSATNMPAQREFFRGSMLTVAEVLADHPVPDTPQVIAAGSHLIRKLKHTKGWIGFSVVVNRVELRFLA